MRLEDQVVSLENAKKLKELGVKQESFCAWFQHTHNDCQDWEIRINTQQSMVLILGENEYAAFTVAELGKILPCAIGDITKDNHYDLYCFKDFPNDWFVQYRRCGKENTLWKNLDIHCDQNLAEGMAKMLIHLIENSNRNAAND